MDLKTYLKSLPDDAAREAFATACETSIGHLRNCVYVPGKTLNPATCVLAERASGRALTRRHLRPNDWWLIWPELVTAKHPAPREAATQ